VAFRCVETKIVTSKAGFKTSAQSLEPAFCQNYQTVKQRLILLLVSPQLLLRISPRFDTEQSLAASRLFRRGPA
jgi:hypothetical protein